MKNFLFSPQTTKYQLGQCNVCCNVLKLNMKQFSIDFRVFIFIYYKSIWALYHNTSFVQFCHSVITRPATGYN